MTRCTAGKERENPALIARVRLESEDETVGITSGCNILKIEDMKDEWAIRFSIGIFAEHMKNEGKVINDTD